jgi:hypothetical protein
MAKRLDIAKPLVIEEQANRLTEWMLDREPVYCPPRFDLEQDSWSVSGISGHGRKVTETRGLKFPCPDYDTMYCLFVEDIIYEKRGDIWFITDWGEIREFWSHYSCGY